MSSVGGRAVVWFRRDLRLHDHPALCAALASAGGVLPLFVLDDALLHGRFVSANRAWFLLGSLAALRRDLVARGGDLWIQRGRPAEVVPAFAAEAGAEAVFVSGDAGPYAGARDGHVADALTARGIRLNILPGTFVVEPGDVLNSAGRPYSVFTPFRRAWEAMPRRPILSASARVRSPDADSGGEHTVPDPGSMPTLADLGIAVPTADPRVLPEPGEEAARLRLERWSAGGLSLYAERRDLLAIGGTSRLGQDLHFGLLSPGEVLERCSGPGDGPRVFAGELCWRDFYAHVLWHWPHAARGSFHPAYDAVPWRDDPETLAAWTEGRTGYPVIDAAMRQLRATGWMPNRARMIVASFLTKDLLIDWRAGEAHFMTQLVDGDLASNNGGWQWAASTGTDAQPYFRIFNPVAQGERFDPGGGYVRRWVPELALVPGRYVHAPWTMPLADQREAGCLIGRDYPRPIVDHGAARERALAAYRSIRTRSAERTGP